MAAGRRNILLKISGDPADAQAAIKDVTKDIAEFGRERATAEVKVDAAQAKRDIAEVKAELASLPKRETIMVRIAGEQAKAAALEKRIAAMQAQSARTGAAGQDTSAVDQRIGALAGQLEASRSRMSGLVSDFEKLGRDGEQNVGKVDKAIGGLTQGLVKARTGLVDLLDHVPLLGGLMSGIAGGVQKLVTTLLPEAAQGFAGLLSAGLSLAAVGPVVLVLVAAFAALVVSLGEALIGVAALAVAFLAALGPIALIVGLVVEKLRAAYQAQQNLVQATDAQRQAVIALQQAQTNESNQRLAALNAQREAVLALKDAENQTADAKLGVTSAQLALQSARLTLANFKKELAGLGIAPGNLLKGASGVDVGGNLGQQQAGANPLACQQMLLQYRQDILAVEQAQQGYKDSIQGVADAQNQQANAQQTANQFAKSGLKAYAPYAQAIAQTATAVLALRTATHALTVDQRKVAASDGILGTFDKLKHTLGVLLGPATKAALSGLGQAFGILGKGLKPLEGPLTKLGHAIGEGFVQLARVLTSKTAIADFRKLIDGAAKLVPVLIGFFSGVGGILIGVANAAMPALTSGLKKLGDKFIDVAKHPQKIEEFITKCLSQTKLWIGVLGSLASSFKTLAGLAQAFAFPIENASKAISNIEAISKANQQAAAQGNQALSGTNALVSKDRAALKSGVLDGKALSSHMRAFLTTQIKNLLAEIPSIKANMQGGAGGGFSGGLYNLLSYFLPLHASGGLATGPSAGIFGEAGPEMILPLTPTVMQTLSEALMRSFVPQFGAYIGASLPRRDAVAGGLSPGAHSHITHSVTQHFGAAPDPEHYAAVMRKRLEADIAGLGVGFR